MDPQRTTSSALNGRLIDTDCNGRHVFWLAKTGHVPQTARIMVPPRV